MKIARSAAAADTITSDAIIVNACDPDRIAIAGDSVGGGMTAALALMARERGDVHFVHQSMYYPVTDAAMDTGSYEQFAEGYFLTANAMAWFWDAYAPDVERRSEAFASPLRASNEQLADLPPAFQSSTRPTCCATRVRHTPPSSASPESRSRPSGTTGGVTTSCCSTR
jgi:alpha/beta hydrolase fold